MPEEMIDKEPAYFSLLKKSRPPEKFFSLFDNVRDELYIGEASTAYLTDKDSARMIYEHNHEAKIIIILRNPAKRAFSLYNWMVQDGYEKIGNFEKALRIENQRKCFKIPNRNEPEYFHNYQYVNSGFYFEQVKRYYDLFGKERIYVMKFEDFKNNPENEYIRLCNFLKIEVNTFEPEPQNPSYFVPFARVQFFMRKVTTLLLLSKSCLVNTDSMEKRDWLMNIGVIKKKPPKPLNIKTYLSLIDKYAEDVKMLSDLTKIDFHSWLVEK